MSIWSKNPALALAFIMIILGLVLFCMYQNNSIVITKSNYKNPKIPSDFDGFTIAHISDLHNKMFGDNQAEILNNVRSLSPDIIVVTGDQYFSLCSFAGLYTGHIHFCSHFTGQRHFRAFFKRDHRRQQRTRLLYP